ncbi:MAG: TetR/AcrR family transcriptional regulator [Ktedonobacterales bacterium]
MENMSAAIDTTTSDLPPARKPGRPRSQRAHRAILEAVLQLLIEMGYQGMSLEAVAARAGVGKTTIYRRWSSKEQLVIDALASLETNADFIETGDLRADLIAHLRRELDPRAQQFPVVLLFRLLGEVLANPDLFAIYHERVVAPQIAQLATAVERSKARGELRPDVSPELFIELLAGPIMTHFIVTGEMTLPDEFPERIVDAAWRGVAADRTQGQR